MMDGPIDCRAPDPRDRPRLEDPAVFGRQINWATPEPQHLRLVTTPQHEEDMALAEAWLRDGDAYSRLREAALFALREYESYIETREAAIEQREQQMDELRTKIHNLI